MPQINYTPPQLRNLPQPAVSAGLDLDRAREKRKEEELRRQQRATQVSQAPSAFPAQEPVEVKEAFSLRLGKMLGSVFGGRYIGEYIGTKIAEHSPDAQRLREVAPEYKDKNLFETPTGKQIAGDVIQAGTNIAAAAIPGAGSLVGKVAQGAAVGYGADVANKLQKNANLGDVVTPGIGTGVGIALPVVAKGLGSLLKGTLGQSTGVKKVVIDRAVKNPERVNKAIRQYAQDDSSKQGLVERAKSAVQEFLGRRNSEFGASISSVKFSKPFTKQEVVSSFTDELSKFKGKVVGEELQFNSSKLTAADKSDLRVFWDGLKTWKDFTPSGVEDLRQFIKNNIDDFAATKNSRASVVLGAVKNSVTNGLETRAPGYKEILGTYGKQTQLARDVLSELNLKSSNSKPSTQLNSVMRLFKKDPQIIKNLTEIMGEDEANNLLDDISGALLSDAFPQGLRGLITEGSLTLGGLYAIISGAVPIPGVVAAAISTSPRVVGEAATLAGKAIKKGAGTGAQRISAIGASELAN